jgi:enoyl-CoA hydratase
MILTGRAVGGEEAYDMGLANRLAEKGKAREEAEILAAGIGSFPQACMQSDRLAVYAGFDMPFDEAMALEFKMGIEVLKCGEFRKGAKRFSEGIGKHGRF